MFEILTVIVFAWLLWQVLRLALKVTWGAAKIIATILMAVALPLLVVFLVIGGALLIVPVVLIAIALIVLKILL